jgi:hypothetical protein
MSRRFLTPLNVLHLATPPSSPSVGDVYFNTTDKALYTWDGSHWVNAGTQGTQGIQGSTGLQGTTGAQGTTGIQGTDGIQGTQGLQGIAGEYAAQGVQGAQGIQGVQGSAGYVGSDGAQGVQGTAGMALIDLDGGNATSIYGGITPINAGTATG